MTGIVLITKLTTKPSNNELHTNNQDVSANKSWTQAFKWGWYQGHEISQRSKRELQSRSEKQRVEMLCRDLQMNYIHTFDHCLKDSSFKINFQRENGL